MSEAGDLNHSILNLSEPEKRAYSHLFALADKDSLGVVTGENAVGFFEKTKLSTSILGEIWQIADNENRGLLTKPGFCIVLRLIGHVQAGSPLTKDLAFKQAPLPKFDGISYPPSVAGTASTSPTAAGFPPGALQPQLSGQGGIRVPPLDPIKVQQYAGLFERSGAQNGLLDGGSAKNIFEKAGLSNEILGRIWNLADREQRGALNQTEFIVAMHLLTCMKMRAMPGLPSALPPGLYEAAARRGVPPSPGQRQSPGRAAVPAQFTGSGAGVPRTSSPLASSPLASRPTGFGPPPNPAAQIAGPPWLVAPAEKAKYDQFFSNIDRAGRGVISGDQAVTFFSDSGLPEDTLASIWDLADINSEGQLTRDEFAVAMFLIRQQRMQNAAPLPAFLPPALVPPSMRRQQPSQPIPVAALPSTAPAFDNANNTSNLPKSAADDLFGLDELTSSPQPSQPALQPQATGASAQGAKDSAAAPASPQRFQPQPQAGAGPMFKPFIPTSAFGASLQAQNTGGSQGSAAGQSRNFSAPAAQQAPVHSGLQQQRAPVFGGGDDLLGDSEASTAESAQLTNETTELANMSNQIGNLRGQMETTQSKKQATQADLNATSSQKRDLELRLQQFRSQYENEVRAVKDLEIQLATSKESTKKLGQELAMLEGTYQDLSTQHQQLASQLAQDQQENSTLKQRITELNAEVGRLKPDIEKLQMEARKERGMVSINKKQLSTNEGERDRLTRDKEGLEKTIADRDAAAAAVAAEPANPPVQEDVPPVNRSMTTSPASITTTNPFHRKTSSDAPAGERSVSPATAMATAPNPSAFDAIFGPAFTKVDSRSGTPPATSFVGRSVAPSSTDANTAGGNVRSEVTPPASERGEEVLPPPPPENRQFTPGILGMFKPGGGSRDQSIASSTRVVPPASRAGGVETPLAPSSRIGSPAPALPFTTPSSAFAPPSYTEPEQERSRVPGSFPEERPPSQDFPTPIAGKDDFETTFADFGDQNKSKEVASTDPFAPVPSGPKPSHGGLANEFPPIQSLEGDEESDSDDDSDAGKRGFDDNFTPASSSQQTDAAAAISAPTAAQDGHDNDHGSIQQTSDPGMAVAQQVERRRSIQEAGARPVIKSVESTTSTLPPPEAQQSPPSYEENIANAPSSLEQTTSPSDFPKEFAGLLPAREDPTSPPPPAAAPPGEPQAQSSSASVPAATAAPAVAPAEQATSTQPVASKNVFDDFDEFDGLAEAKEDRADIDFDFGKSPGASTDFNPTFDSSAGVDDAFASTVGERSASGFESANGFEAAPAFGSSNSSIQNTPQHVQHDWDAIFSGLDNSKDIDTSFNSANDDPWSDAPAAPTTNGAATGASPQASTQPTPSKAQTAAQAGRAITPGTEHDDPILKRLTGMGYPRADALSALEKYDYDINKAVDHLTTN